jgi:peptidoglycan/LPS O-acetylase OafA/YrhL
MHHQSIVRASRQHDLDALRAFAMLLGIALHAALSFTAFPWLVQDLKQHTFFGTLFAAIHGFRMQLFILISGYFTMMLWRKRGKFALMKQRLLRVFLPCMLGLVTIVPAMDWSSKYAMKLSSEQDVRRKANLPKKSELVDAIRKKDVSTVEQLLSNGADPNLPDPTFGMPPLGWAALYGDTTLAKMLLDHDADLDVTDRDGFTPLHQAAFMGQHELVKMFIEHGADVGARSMRGDRPITSAKTSWMATQWVAYSMRLPLKKEAEVQKDREVCIDLLKSLGETEDEPTPKPIYQNKELKRIRGEYLGYMTSDQFNIKWTTDGDPFHLIFKPAFHHLWFLWMLCWLVSIFIIVAVALETIRIPRLPSWFILSPGRFLWLIPITMVPQLFMGTLFPTFGPDTSIGVIPQPHLLLYYAFFFGFGAIYYDSDDQKGRVGRFWWLAIPIALFVLLPYGRKILSQVELSGLVQVTYAWLMCFGMMGMFRTLIKSENRTIRYLSDSAYWLYIAHLPLIVLAQVWVREWNWPVGWKFLFVCSVVTGFLLLTYELFVRYYWLGRLLNGKRTRKKPVQESVVSADSHPNAVSSD